MVDGAVHLVLSRDFDGRGFLQLIPVFLITDQALVVVARDPGGTMKPAPKRFSTEYAAAMALAGGRRRAVLAASLRSWDGTLVPKDKESTDWRAFIRIVPSIRLVGPVGFEPTTNGL